MVIPAATAARMPDTPICSAIEVRGERQQEQQDDLRRRFITTPAAKEAQRASVQPAHYEAREDTANRHLEEFEGRAAYGKDHRAHGNRHGKLQGDRPEASFISASPCKMPMIFFGMRPSPTMPDSATASVGDSTAASAKAGMSGIPGTAQ